MLHWRDHQALLNTLRKAGHQVDFEERPTITTIRGANPDAIVIDLSVTPSRGRDYATYLRGSKSLRHLPIVFVDGEPEKVEKVRELLPDAVYTTLAKVAAAVKRAISKAPAAPVVPPQYMERWTGRTTAQKMGIVEGSRVALLDAPPDYARVLGELPKDVSLEEEPDEVLPVTLWFVRDPEVYIRALPRKRSIAARTKFWVVWPKGKRDGINQFVIRETALELGLVDYKICSVNEVWTAMVFAVKKK
jgi:CheY-like chemotaxis protein